MTLVAANLELLDLSDDDPLVASAMVRLHLRLAEIKAGQPRRAWRPRARRRRATDRPD